MNAIRTTIENHSSLGLLNYGIHCHLKLSPLLHLIRAKTALLICMFPRDQRVTLQARKPDVRFCYLYSQRSFTFHLFTFSNLTLRSS